MDPKTQASIPSSIGQAAARRRRMAAPRRHLREHHSAVGTDELLALNFSRSAIGRLVEDETLISTTRGSYRSGLAAPTTNTWLRGMLLSAGDSSALARASASHHQGFLHHPPREPEIVVPRRVNGGRRDGFRLHAATDLREEDVLSVDGLRCTSPTRTIVDLAIATRTAAEFRVLRRTVRQATAKDKRLPFDLEDVLRTRRPFRGSRILATVLENHLPSTVVQRSELETKFLELCRRHGLPIPETNAMAGGFEVDVLWRLHRVFVELDTFEYHGGTVLSFERDRERDAVLTAAGFRGMRVTDTRLRREPLKVVRQVRTLLNLSL